MTLKEMVGMGLNEEAKLGEYTWIVRIRRVPGGWIYLDPTSNHEGSSTFVPLPAVVEPVKDVDY